jgi:hypothetical protein
VERGTVDSSAPGRGWPRAAGLLGVVLAMSAVNAVNAGVLIAVPLLALLVWNGLRGFGVVLAAVVAVFIVAAGTRDGIWYAERAWTVLVAGGFLALTMLLPAWRLSTRALAAVTGAAAVAGALLAVRSDAWGALDAAVSGEVRAMADQQLGTLRTLGRGQPPSDAMVTAMQQLAETQAAVFPAMIAIASMAALGVAWWIRTRLVGEGDQGLGPLKDFRFNDHLVWIFIGGLLLLFAQWGDALVRVGSNTIVFMSALYMLRGAAVFVFLSGGMSLFGFVTVVVGLVFAAPFLMGMAVLIGVGDTWLDIRSRVRERTA